MIVDCYTHIWDAAGGLGTEDRSESARTPFPPLDFSDPHIATPTRHAAMSEAVDHSIVLGYRAELLGAHVTNDKIAEYVKSRPEKLIGFAGVDLSKPREAVDEIVRATTELGLRGVAVAPAAQDVHPNDSQAMVVYEKALEHDLPVFFHPGITLSRATRLEYARPILLDEIARELPDLRIVVAHMGLPWYDETCLLLAKHDNVFAEISWLMLHPWQGYQALLSAWQYGVIDKLLFGSGFPVATPADAIEALYDINHFCHGTNLPAIPRDLLRGIVERDALALLGLAKVAV